MQEGRWLYTVIHLWTRDITDLFVELKLFHPPLLPRHGPCQGKKKRFNAPPVASSGVVRHECGLASISTLHRSNQTFPYYHIMCLRRLWTSYA